MLSFPPMRSPVAPAPLSLVAAAIVCALPAPAQAVHRAFEPVARNWTSGAFFGKQGTFFADLNGDGKADAIAVDSAGITVRRSNGSTAFGPREDWSAGSFYGTRGTYFANVTSGTPARADAIAVNAGGITVRRAQAITLSGSEGFGPEEIWTTDAYYGSRENAFADLTGDGRVDAIAVNDDGVFIRRARFTDYFKTCPPPVNFRPRPDFHLPPVLQRPFK